MANLPTDLTRLVEAEYLLLQSGATPDVWIALQEIEFELGRPEFREVATNGGVTYFFGASDHFVDATLLMSITEWGSTLIPLTQRGATGDLTSTSWRLRGTNLNNNTQTATFNGKIVRMRTSKPAEGAVKVRLRIRITSETMTIS